MNELNWKNAEGLRLYAAEWSVPNPKAVIAFVHGQSEHIGRYEHVARWYNRHDIAFIGFDQQGYGRSEGKRGHAKNLDVLLDDIGQLLDETRSRYAGVPLYLYGHSMGGHLALNYTLRRSPSLSGLVATGPWIRLAFPAPAAKIIVARILKKITPALTLPTDLAAHFLSRDEAVVQAYQNDPLVHGQLSIAAGLSLLEGAEWLDHLGGSFDMPTLLMHGGDDRITSPAATKAFAQRARGAVTHREWPGLFHEIHNEKEQEMVFDFTLQWMNGISKTA